MGCCQCSDPIDGSTVWIDGFPWCVLCWTLKDYLSEKESQTCCDNPNPHLPNGIHCRKT